MKDDDRPEVLCEKCGQTWVILTDSPRLVLALAKITGYVCSECAGVDPMDGPFPSVKK